jgi:hypothetical protein
MGKLKRFIAAVLWLLVGMAAAPAHQAVAPVPTEPPPPAPTQPPSHPAQLAPSAPTVRIQRDIEPGDFGPLCQLMQKRYPPRPESTPGEQLRPESTLGKTSTLRALQDAAEQGQLDAEWKLGRMYADGDGVPRDDLRAFYYFDQIATSHPDETPGTPQARFVASAFIALAHYYLTGIPNTKITADRARASDMFGYAATYFGDAEAQYEVGRLYLCGSTRNPYQGERWLQLAATKGYCRAEVALGDMLFEGQVVPRQAPRGLMWLRLARDCAGPDETWVKQLYDSAFKRASDEERAMALVYLEDWLKEDWLKGHRD